LITGLISPIRKRVRLDKSGTRDAFPGTWEGAPEEPGNFKYFSGPAGCRAPITKFRQFAFSQRRCDKCQIICPRESSGSLRTTVERNPPPLVARSAAVLAAGEAREGAALFMPVPAAQIMGVIWMASMYLNRPGRGERKRRRHRASEGKQAQAYSRCQNCRAHDDLPIGAIQLTSFLQRGQGARMRRQLGTPPPFAELPKRRVVQQTR
jgi:ferredoxin